MNRSARAKLNRAVQNLVEAEVANSWAGAQDREGQLECKLKLFKARVHYKRLLDNYTDPVVPPTKKE